MEDVVGMKIALNQRKIVKDVVVSGVLLPLILFNATITGMWSACCLSPLLQDVLMRE